MKTKPGIDPSRIDPEYLMQLSQPLEDVYEAIERDLLVQIARRFKGGARTPKSRVAGSDAWRAYMLEQIGGLHEENYRRIAEYSGDVSAMTQLAVRSSVEQALDAAEHELAQAATQPEYVPQRSQTAQRIMNNYAAQALNHENLVNTVMLNSSLRQYRRAVDDVEKQMAYAKQMAEAQKILNRETGAVVLGAKSYTEAVRHAVKAMMRDGLTGFTDAAGREWSAQAYVQMDIKTTAANAARNAAMQRNEDYGNALIMVSSHPGSRPGCEPWQARVYSTNGTSGTAHDLNGKAIPYIPLSATSYGQPAGLFGINCGHFPSPFVDGVSVLRYETYDHEETQRLYKESQQQRYMERRIRQAKAEADALEAAGDPDGAKAARKKAREMNAELKGWCEEKGRDYLPERTRIVRPGEVAARVLTSDANGGRLEPKGDAIEDAFSIKRGLPKQMSDALAAANPNYAPGTGYGINCQRCVQVYEALRRGYDVEALPKPSSGNTIVWGTECFLPSSTTDAYSVFTQFQNEFGVKHAVLSAPDGSRFIIYANWGNGDAHVFIGENHNGKMYFVDPQTNDGDVGRYFQIGVPNMFAYYRVDDKPLTSDESIIKSTMKKRDHS